MGKISADELAEGMEVILPPSGRMYTVEAVEEHQNGVHMTILLSNGNTYRVLKDAPVTVMA